MSGVQLLLALALAAAPVSGGPAARDARFQDLLRTYPERPPARSLELAEGLVADGDFGERPRAEHWIGSVRLSLGDRAGARAWFARLSREHPGSVWAERAQLGLGDLAAQEHSYGEALARYAAAAASRDPAVRELARAGAVQVRALRLRRRADWAALAFACGVALWLAASLLRHRPVAVLPLPAELRIAGPVLALLSLCALAQDPAPRAAVLEISAGGAALLALSGLRLRAAAPGPAARLAHALATLGALAAVAYAALDRADLLGLVRETLRVGSD